MTQFKSFLKTYEWWLLSAAIGGTYLFAMFAYHIAFSQTGEEVTIPDLVYYAFQLFAMKFTHPKGHIPWQLDVARFLAPFLTGLAGVKAILLVAWEQVRLLKAKTFKGHTVICGLNAKSIRLAADLLENRRRVVVIDSVEHNTYRQQLLDSGCILISGQPDVRHTLMRARVHRARQLVCFDDNDMKNITTAFLAYHLVKEEGTQPRFSSYVHISDVQSVERMEDLDAFVDKERRKSVTASLRENDIFAFNTHQRAARQLLMKFPPDAAAEFQTANAQPVHIMIFGFGFLGQGLLLQSAMMGHYLNGKRTHVTVAGASSEQNVWERIVKEHQLDQVIVPNFLPVDSQDISQEFLMQAEKEVPVSSIFIVYNDDDETFRVVHRLHSLRTCQRTRIAVAMSKPDGILNLLPNAIGEHESPVKKFDIVGETCTGEAIIGENVDELARIIHADYLATQRKRGTLDPAKHTHRDWTLLTDDVKNHNRSQADHLWVKLRAIGCTTRPKTDAAGSFDISDHPDLVEQLAAIEHNRWCAYMLINGWRRGGERDDAMKIHAELVPYGELSEEIKQYDRDTVMNIPRLLERLGLMIVKSVPTISQ